MSLTSQIEAHQKLKKKLMVHQFMHKISSWPLQKFTRPPSYVLNVQLLNKFELLKLSHHIAKLNGYVSCRNGHTTLLFCLGRHLT